MMHKLKSILFAMLLAGVFISCSSSPETKIVGTWVPVDASGKKDTGLKIHFRKNMYLFAEVPSNREASRDSISYIFKNEGKLLVTKDKSGREDELVILELTNKNLIMHPRSDKKDTIRFVKE